MRILVAFLIAVAVYLILGLLIPATLGALFVVSTVKLTWVFVVAAFAGVVAHHVLVTRNLLPSKNNL